jgi:hypothetical protein
MNLDEQAVTEKRRESMSSFRMLKGIEFAINNNLKQLTSH